eukprot:Hpha_TRINITY_DN9736_c0_g1::TRINITY_DN9736_c0_g1_i2::g.10395::m.10395
MSCHLVTPPGPARTLVRSLARSLADVGKANEAGAVLESALRWLPAAKSTHADIGASFVHAFARTQNSAGALEAFSKMQEHRVQRVPAAYASAIVAGGGTPLLRRMQVDRVCADSGCYIGAVSRETWASALGLLRDAKSSRVACSEALHRAVAYAARFEGPKQAHELLHTMHAEGKVKELRTLALEVQLLQSTSPCLARRKAERLGLLSGGVRTAGEGAQLLYALGAARCVR